MLSGNCRVCGEEFEMGKNVFTQAGVLETRITKFCEVCFDACTSEDEGMDETTEPPDLFSDEQKDLFTDESWNGTADEDDGFIPF